MKVPPHIYEHTVTFYRDILGLRQIDARLPSVVFEFGTNQLWIDPVPELSQAEAWFEIECDDMEAAAEHLASSGVIRRDEIEPLPDGFRGFWVSSPAQIIHLVQESSR